MGRAGISWDGREGRKRTDGWSCDLVGWLVEGRGGMSWEGREGKGGLLLCLIGWSVGWLVSWLASALGMSLLICWTERLLFDAFARCLIG